MQKSEQILFLSFNQDQGCFSCGTENGFKIFNTYPFKEAYNCEMGGGIGIVEMLYRCNILALVGGGKNPKYPPNKLMLWDDHRTKNIGEMSFRSEVKAIKLKGDRIVVVLELKIFVYNFSDLKLVDHIETCQNPQGLCSINTEGGDYTILAYPDKTPGNVNVQLYNEKRTTNIKAHESQLFCLQLNPKGKKVATASQKGTVIRLYDTSTGQLLQELRRGTEYAQIYSIAFDPTGLFMACSSDSGTVHIFAMKLDQTEKGDLENKNVSELKNPKSKLSFMKSLVPYFDSEWSFAQFRILDSKESKTKVAFGSEPNTIIVISQDGNYYQAQFDQAVGGECVLKEESKIIFNSTNQN